MGRLVIAAFPVIIAALGSATHASARAERGPARETGTKTFRMCEITNGQVFSCGPWFQGKAVAHHDGAFRSCDITNGRVFSCGPWFQGKAVVPHDGALRSCEIVNGGIFSCGPWFQGKAVVLVDDR